MSRIGPDLPFLRLSQTPKAAAKSLGVLAPLVGTWVGGKGWNVIAVPSGPRSFRVLARPYTETIEFEPIGAKVPNRGQGTDQFIPGLHYTLKVADNVTNEPMHIENGMFLRLKQEDGSFAIARVFSVPHGDALLAIGRAIPPIIGRPPIGPAPTAPTTGPNTPLGYLDAYSVAQVELIQQGFDFDIGNPNSFLDKTLDAQEAQGRVVQNTLTFEVSTTNQTGGIHNIPFIKKNADATRLSSTFWIETVLDTSTDTEFLQLQYTQNTVIEFFPKFGAPGRIEWPHVDVNTLVKQ